MTKEIQEVKELTAVADEIGLVESKAAPIVANFQDFFQQAVEKRVKAMALTVTSENQVDKMAEAREARLDIRRIRIDCEKRRKELKEASLKTGRLIDGMANVIKGMIEPTEEHLEKQEKYAEIKEDECNEKARAEREKQLAPYVDDVSMYNLKDMAPEAFDILLKGAVSEFERIKNEQEEKERERIAEEERIKIEQETIRKENDQLKKEAEEKEKALAEERAEREKAESERLKKEQQENEKRQAAEKKAEQERIRLEKEAEEKAGDKKLFEEVKAEFTNIQSAWVEIVRLRKLIGE